VMPPQGRGQAGRQARHAQGYYPPCCRSFARQPLRAAEGNLGAGGGMGPELQTGLVCGGSGEDPRG